MWGNVETKKMGRILEKTEDWNLHNQLFGDTSRGEESWEATEKEFDLLIREYDLNEDKGGKEKRKNEELKKENFQLKKQIRGLKKNAMKLQESVNSGQRKYNELATTTDETIAALESQNESLRTENELLKKNQGQPPCVTKPHLLKSHSSLRISKSPSSKMEINNNSHPPSVPKIKRRVSAISQLIQGFEAAAVAEAQKAKVIAHPRRQTVPANYCSSL